MSKKRDASKSLFFRSVDCHMVNRVLILVFVLHCNAIDLVYSIIAN